MTLTVSHVDLAMLLQVDEEPPIRANTTILLGNLAPHLSEATCKRVMLNAFTRALKDSFPPARSAGLKVTHCTVFLVMTTHIAALQHGCECVSQVLPNTAVVVLPNVPCPLLSQQPVLLIVFCLLCQPSCLKMALLFCRPICFVSYQCVKKESCVCLRCGVTSRNILMSTQMPQHFGFYSCPDSFPTCLCHKDHDIDHANSKIGCYNDLASPSMCP